MCIVCIFLQRNLKIWKSVIKFVSEEAKFSDLILLAIFSNDTSFEDKKRLTNFFCLSVRGHRVFWYSSFIFCCLNIWP